MMKNYYIHSSSYVDDNAIIGENTKIWHFSHIQSGARIGKNCSLGQNVNVGNNVIIGDYVKIQNNVSIYEGVILEDGVFCGPSCVFTNDLTPRARYPKGRDHYKKTRIKKGATLGANSTIVCGISIGCNAMVGAGAVVTKDVPDNALVTGTPAKITGWVCECGMRLDKKGICSICKKQYQIQNPQFLIDGKG